MSSTMLSATRLIRWMPTRQVLQRSDSLKKRCSSWMPRADPAITSKFVDTGSGQTLPDEFYFEPNFLSPIEQLTLLSTSLKKLDSLASSRSRRMRRRKANQLRTQSVAYDPLMSLFHADEDYEFEEGHFDGVIKTFREMHVTSWPTEDLPQISPILDRMKSLVPSVPTQTHILHLGTSGEILPHLDNVDASGSWILGVSLGATRVLRLENRDDSNDAFEVLLPSGSLYIQRDRLRYRYTHSVLLNSTFRGKVPTGGQRISIMMRDKKCS